MLQNSNPLLDIGCNFLLAIAFIIILSVAIYCITFFNDVNRKQLQRLVYSHKFHVGIVILVVIDLIIVLAELLIDLEIIRSKSQ